MKYLVRVSCKDHNDLIYIIKAKNEIKLEAFMKIVLKDQYEYINGYEYQEIHHISRRWQNKHKLPDFDLCGNWIGANFLKE